MNKESDINQQQEIELALLEPNTLAAIGLKSILQDLLPHASVHCFSTFEELISDTPYAYVHYFVSSTEYFAHVPFFHELGHRVILLVHGTDQELRMHLPCIDVTQTEHAIIHQLMRHRQQGGARGEKRSREAFHGPDFGTRRLPQNPQSQPDLSPREVEVLRLMVRGLINKEIARTLSISLATVITHRQHIQEKTGIRSLSGLTVYAVLCGYVRIEEV